MKSFLTTLTTGLVAMALMFGAISISSAAPAKKQCDTPSDRALQIKTGSC